MCEQQQSIKTENNNDIEADFLQLKEIAETMEEETMLVIQFEGKEGRKNG